MEKTIKGILFTQYLVKSSILRSIFWRPRDQPIYLLTFHSNLAKLQWRVNLYEKTFYTWTRIIKHTSEHLKNVRFRQSFKFNGTLNHLRLVCQLKPIYLKPKGVRFCNIFFTFKVWIIKRMLSYSWVITLQFFSDFMYVMNVNCR